MSERRSYGGAWYEPQATPGCEPTCRHCANIRYRLLEREIERDRERLIDEARD